MADSWVLEGEQIVRELETKSPAVVWDDFTTVSTGGVQVFVNGSSVEGTYLTGSSVVTANVQTLPLITFPTGSGGLTVVIEPSVNANSQRWKTGIIYRVLKPGAAR